MFEPHITLEFIHTAHIDTYTHTPQASMQAHGHTHSHIPPLYSVPVN